MALIFGKHIIKEPTENQFIKLSQPAIDRVKQIFDKPKDSNEVVEFRGGIVSPPHIKKILCDALISYDTK